MNLEVIRFSSQADSTSGLLFENTVVGRNFLCYTLEDEYRVLKIKGETRIPAGTYDIKFRKKGRLHTKYSKKHPTIHRGMLHITDVPNFEYILIHTGNTDEHTAGCLILGDAQENNVIVKNGWVGKSSNAYKRIYPLIAAALEKEEKVTITYTDYDE